MRKVRVGVIGKFYCVWFELNSTCDFSLMFRTFSEVSNFLLTLFDWRISSNFKEVKELVLTDEKHEIIFDCYDSLFWGEYGVWLYER